MKLGEDIRLPDSKCTNCGKEINAASCVGSEGKPKPGDFTVCIGCGHIMAFNEDLILRDITDTEAVEIAGDRRILAVQWARGKVKDNVK